MGHAAQALRLLLVRELDDRPGLTRPIQNHLVDSCTGRNTELPRRLEATSRPDKPAKLPKRAAMRPGSG